MTFTLYLEHDGETYILPNYQRRETALDYVSWYERHYGQTKYRIEAIVK